MISGAAFNINFYCGIFLLVCISIDRYLSIVHGTRLHSQNKPRLAHISCLSVWLVSLILAIPDCVFLTVRTDSVEEKQLRTDSVQQLCIHTFSQSGTDWKLVSRLLHHTLGFLLPAAALVICCCFIVLRLHRGSKGLQKQRAVRVILPLVVVFFLFWMPYNITLIVDTIRGSSKESANEHSLKRALRVTSALGCMHACLRPLLYLILCGNFRNLILAMFKRAAVESKGSLWELGVGEEVLPDQNHEGEERKQMTSVDHQIQSTQC